MSQDNLDMCRIDEGRVAMTCWNLCKHNYLHPPYIDEHLPVVTDTKICTLFWLFCVFCRLSEPGIYPPVIDYEEVSIYLNNTKKKNVYIQHFLKFISNRKLFILRLNFLRKKVKFYEIYLLHKESFK